MSPRRTRRHFAFLVRAAALGALLGACGGPRPAPPGARYYAATVVTQRNLKAEHFQALAEQLPGLLGDRAVVLEDARGAQRPLAPRAMTPALRQALYIVLTTGDPAAQEFDLRVRLADDRRVPVTVRRAPDDGFIVRAGSVESADDPRVGQSQDKSPRDLTARYGIGPLTEKGATWTPRAKAVLDLTLERLNDAELRVLSGLPFLRQPRGDDPSHGALYRQVDCEAEIQLYDYALRSDTDQFVGEPEAPLPTSVRTLLHEVGHAIHQRPGRLAWCALERHERGLNERIQKANDRAERFNRGQGELSESVREREFAAIEAEGRAIEAARRAFERETAAAEALMNEGPALAGYRRALGAASPPTAYGETSPTESFAESYSLYRSDPAALRRLLPAVFAFFERGEHLSGD